MITLKSNLKSVIAQMEQYQAGLPGCVQRALSPPAWEGPLRQLAEKSLRAQFLLADVQARARYEKLLPRILDTLLATLKPGGATFSLLLPFQIMAELDLEGAAQQAGLAWTPTGRERKQFQRQGTPEAYNLKEANLAAAKQAVLDWVTYEKNWDERDAGKSVEEVADRIQVILGLKPAMRGRNSAMEEAASGLSSAIQSWLAQDEATPGGTEISSPATDPFRHQPGHLVSRSGLTNAEARRWLTAVLQSWTIYFQRVFKDRLAAELTKLHRKINTQQPSLL